jgi:hypothetical protein
MSRDVGPREAALRATREARLATEDVRRKERAAIKSADTGSKLVERIQKAALKRGKPRKARKPKK